MASGTGTWGGVLFCNAMSMESSKRKSNLQADKAKVFNNGSEGRCENKGMLETSRAKWNDVIFKQKNLQFVTPQIATPVEFPAVLGEFTEIPQGSWPIFGRSRCNHIEESEVSLP
ncbi:hypothetical protein AVEN_44680-1 [Araneus ventricosus]|uniref:Uncharacterized protein n=1 Tax=Araneus ventricosus TaxID=182803 RepID=A0A4Y2ULE1_ARAVE|nr:hypothetical protein AVEN_182311-1 [Araneus ventricosus]GBO13471.1 hypothetical protein AVEN_44680-1 [Araneus ventricosus]